MNYWKNENMKKKECGKFCELYGNTIRNRILEYIFEINDLDFAVGDMAQDTGISRPKAYEMIKELEKKKYIKKSRIVAGTQLFILNKKNKEIEFLMKNFKECLKLVIEEHSEKTYSAGKSVGAVSAKPF